MKIKKLDTRGVTHSVLAIAFVVIFAISGVGYVVSSHADSCPPGSTSGTAPSVACGSKVKCEITNAPDIAYYKQVIKPKVTLVNNGPKVSRLSVHVTQSRTDSNGVGHKLRKSNFTQGLKSGHSSTHKLSSYTVRNYATDKVRKISWHVTYANGYPACSWTTTIPSKAASTPKLGPVVVAPAE